MHKLNLDFNKVAEARSAAKNIAVQTQAFIDAHSTVTIERTIVRLLGVDGIDAYERPLPNAVVEDILQGGGMTDGAAYWLGNAMYTRGESAQTIAEAVAEGTLHLTALPKTSPEKIYAFLEPYVLEAVERIRNRRIEREKLIETLGEGSKPYLYVIVATGNIYEDMLQAQAAARQGADIIAVIRTTAQSLLDYVPYGATTEGFGGTYATQENFKLMRKALDEVGEEVHRYIRLCNYCSGLCMPEIAAMGALERLDVMLNDALYGILFRDINMQRTLVDQFFSRVINGFAGIIINTGEDNYLTTSDAIEEAHTVLASQFINEQFALLAGLPPAQMGLGHAFEMNPDVEDGFLMELAQAQMAREIFPEAPLKYMPPTKYMTGDIFKGHIQDAMFNMASIMTGQGIQLLGMLTEAIHTPLLHDRALSIANAKYIFNNMRHISEEIEFKQGGRVQSRANLVLDEATKLLKEIEGMGIIETIEQGKFADVTRKRDGGKGLEGVFEKSSSYDNPFIKHMLQTEKEAIS
ncbi:MAG: beta-lysine 5,6-aminomutase alpha subunit [Clostridiales bacterium]|jgi:beta-lysine 5,6-aminomutase alpha subunit|nr:beta-lysine 5,6-aminomutase alpha subunit [Clostridiales bacterium]